MTTITQTITALPTAPDPATMTRAQFNTAAAASVLAQKAMTPEINTWAGQANTVAGEVNAAAAATAVDAGDASDSADAAAASEALATTAATNAANAPNTSATSVTSMASGTGSKAFTLVEVGKTFVVGQWVNVTDTSAPTTNWFRGVITAFTPGTGAITVNSVEAVGSATSTTWSVVAATAYVAKDTSGGVAGLTLYKLNMRNVAGTFTSFQTNTNTAARTYTWQDASYTVAGIDYANTWSAAQVFGDQVLSRGMTKDMGAVYLDKGNSGTSTQTLDYTAGSHQKITVTGAHTIATSNWPPTGNLGELMLELVNGASSVVTWPTVNWVKSDGSFTTTFASNGVTLQTSGTDFALLWSRDGGSTIYGKFMR